MKAAFFEAHGDLEKIRVGEIDKPSINDNEVLIETRFSALNHIDLFIVQGWPGLNLNLPHVLGSDGSGTIKQIGSSVTTLNEGDRVVINPGLSCGKCFSCLSGQHNFCKNFSIMGEHQWGTYANYFKVPEENAIKIPSNLGFDIAAAAPLTFLTAWRALVSQANLKKFESLFVHGAGGGVSSAAIQIAKFIGARVITTTSSTKKMEMAKKLGADHVINYNEEPSYSKRVFIDLTMKQGVDVVLDSVGAVTFQTSLRMLKPGGRLVTPGSTTGPLSEIDIRQIFWKQLEVKGTTMSNQREFREVMNLIFKGDLTPVIDSVYPLDDIIKAEKHLQEGNQFGKVLLKVN
jgi:NADPH:quinone reductase-like Zn-dependent oxidoreductase